MKSGCALILLGLLLTSCHRQPSGRYVSAADKPRVIDVVDASTLHADWLKEGDPAMLTYRYTCDGRYVSVFDREKKVAILIFDSQHDELRINPIVFTKKK